ncbi:MAG: exosortase family protein XrtF [Bacteroidia bacterium]|nr:exosortase family protein XrtF [Bacteroidia bacterium]
MIFSAFNIKNPLLKFILFFIFIYSFFYFIHENIIKEFTYWDNQFIAHIIIVSEKFLNFIGYKTFKALYDTGMQALGIHGSNGVWVGSPCNAISLFILFMAFIIPFPGNHKHKWWYILLGIFIIHLVNIIRVILLCLLAYYSPFQVDFNHTYTFTFIVYLLIFLLWVIWVKRFSGIESSENIK